MNHGVGYKLKFISDRIKANADADMKQLGLTHTQLWVFSFLVECNGQATQKEIERELRVSHPTVVGVISRMEQNGFLRTWTDPNDRRNKIVHLTEQAAELDNLLDGRVEQHDRDLLAGLTPEEIDQLDRLLSHIISNIE